MKKEIITMTIKRIINGCLTGLAIFFILLVTADTSSGVVYNLTADSTTENYSGSVVPMWGFGLCTDDTFTTCDPVSIPGPEITVPAGEALTINLKNNLAVPASIIIPGQSINPAPTDLGGRVMSFTAEAAPGGTTTYFWSNFKAGTYIYQSGTNPAVQVQMGLYGVAKKDFAAGSAYSGVTYDNEVTLLFSEVDPVLHQAVADGKYGDACANPPCTVTSTIDFHPKFFLINGSPYSSGQTPIPAGNTWDRTLLRFANAGLRDYVPVLQGLYMSIVAEDGNLLPYSKNQYSIILPAGKTSDAVITTDTAGIFPIYDRRLHLANGIASPGGMLTYIEVAAAAGGHSAVNDSYAAPYNGTLVVPAPGVLGNDLNPNTLTLTAALETNVSHGTLILNANGSFTYSPSTNYSGTDSFIYKAVGNGQNSNVATVLLTMTRRPVAVNDSATTRRNRGVTINAVANDYDPDGTINPASIVIVSAPVKGGTVTINSSYKLRYVPRRNFYGTDTFTYKVADNSGLFSNVATVVVYVRR